MEAMIKISHSQAQQSKKATSVTSQFFFFCNSDPSKPPGALRDAMPNALRLRWSMQLSATRKLTFSGLILDFLRSLGVVGNQSFASFPGHEWCEKGKHTEWAAQSHRQVSMAGANGDSLRPMSSFQPASSLARDMNSSTSTSSGAGPVVQPRPRPLIRGAQGSGTTVLVNNCQRGNPVLQHIRNIGWEYADIVPDYQVGLSSCVLFLSIRYHRLHPEYVHTRISKLQQMYTLRVLLVLCDVNDHQAAIRELTKVSMINSLTMVLAWSAEEAGKYIETYKSFEHKPPDAIKERIGEDYLAQVTNVLTQIRGINRTDVVTLLSTFGTLRGVVNAEVAQVAMCPGFGEVKAKRLCDAVRMPFRVGETRTFKQRKSTASTTATRGAGSEAPAQPAAAPTTRALDTLEAQLDTLPDLEALDGEEDLDQDEHLRLAIQLSMQSDS